MIGLVRRKIFKIPLTDYLTVVSKGGKDISLYAKIFAYFEFFDSLQGGALGDQYAIAKQGLLWLGHHPVSHSAATPPLGGALGNIYHNEGTVYFFTCRLIWKQHQKCSFLLLLCRIRLLVSYSFLHESDNQHHRYNRLRKPYLQ